LLAWSAPGKPIDVRTAAIGSLGTVGKGNKDVTQALVSYLDEPRISKYVTVFAIGRHGDPDAIPALENLLKSGKLFFGLKSITNRQIESLRAQAAGEKSGESAHRGGAAREAAAASDNAAILDELEKLEKRFDEMNARLEKIEEEMRADKK